MATLTSVTIDLDKEQEYTEEEVQQFVKQHGIYDVDMTLEQVLKELKEEEEIIGVEIKRTKRTAVFCFWSSARFNKKGFSVKEGKYMPRKQFSSNEVLTFTIGKKNTV